MSVQQTRERLAQGWTFNAARMGKGWEIRYPHIAIWRGCFGSAGSEVGWKIWLEAACGSEFTSFHTTSYVLAEKQVPRSEGQDRYQLVDDFMRDWIDENGIETLDQFARGWIGETGWEMKYPHIAGWISQGKRHCIRLNINLVTRKSRVKAWHYDKPTNTETMLFEDEVENMSEPEVLRMLDEGIESWLKEY